MSIISIIIIAIGLAMDAFAVSIANSCNLPKMKISEAITMSFSFGFFQAAMPIIGWLAGSTIKDYIQQIGYWIAFVLLVGIGIKMIYESFILDEDEKKSSLSIKILFILSIATSIDALAVGISFSCLDINIYFPALIIGIITLFFSGLGIYLGKKFGHILESKMEIIGGIILILIGLKILLEHTIFA